MLVNQVQDLVNSASKQAFGTETINTLDLTNFVSLGDYLLNSSNENSKDNFFKVFVDMIGRSVVDNRPYDPRQLYLYRDSMEFGCILQRIYIPVQQATLNNSWDLMDGATVDPFVITKTSPKQKLFSNMDTWEIPFTIVNQQIKSAFINSETLGAFIDATFVAMDTSMNFNIERMDSTCISNFIGEKIVSTTQNRGVRHLLSEFNDKFSSTLTGENALDNPDFLRFATSEMNKDLERLTTLSSCYCIGTDYTRATKKDQARILLHNDFVQNCFTNLQSNTFHKELVALPKYTPVTYWQAVGTDYDFGTTSRIDITTASGESCEQSYIIGLITDYEAMGTTIDNRRTTSQNNNKGEYVNYWHKAEMGYFNDLSHNGIVYILD